VVRDLGLADYRRVFDAMRSFTDARGAGRVDEIWLVEHPPVYTLGTNNREPPLANPDGIPVIQSDRGGQITYHGPGQLVAYTLLDLRRRGWGVKRLVQALEQTAIDLLAAHGVAGARRAGAPGVYVAGRKIAQLGLRVRRGASYHGLSFNVQMDLRPFGHIHPCGYVGLETVDLASLVGTDATLLPRIRTELPVHLLRNLGYNAGRTP
jgi:lipoyl(octanoyl) transferase